MKIASFKHGERESYGLVRDSQLIDVGYRLPQFPTLKAFLKHNDYRELDRFAQDRPDWQIADVALLPLIPDPEKIICIGVNYASHLAETGRSPGTYPVVFARFASSQVGAEQAMIKPHESDCFDYEGELAVIIGKGGRRISVDEALHHVAGYSCYNDGSIRDWQRHTSQVTPGKNFPATGAFGPWMVTPDEVDDLGALSLTTRLNGCVVQNASLSDLVFDVPNLIAYCSAFCPLTAGDVIVTGTPGGVGAYRNPPLWMKEGDVVEVEISKIGILRNTVRAERPKSVESELGVLSTVM